MSNPPILEAVDYRRAGQFLRYACPDAVNLDGLNSMLRQAHESGRGTQMILALAALTYVVADGLDTELGQAGLAEFILDQHIKEKETTTDA
ncbi:hypothetical protein ACN93_03805 [Gordonia paraffinivorans]|uniref:hypothetical protein n=1 Tax=Gordonia paraffinivorans TaxID=175628 RepID=UPI000D61B5FB|nr:hypothetical protein [Gordonia paraffinivorans]PWD44539.1 hypothetical protein ACN93_03805 [Gordonia paraffinivorans]